MNNIIIVGAGGFAKELYSYIALDIENKVLNNHTIKGFLDISEDAFLDMKIDSLYLGDENNYQIEENDLFIVAIGNIKLREKIINKLKTFNAKFFTYIHSSAIIAKNATIGEGVIICPNSIIQANSVVMNYCVINIFSSIGHDSTIGENSILSPYCTLNGNVIVGDKLFMGTRSTILLGISVGNNCTISAHTVLRSDIGDGIIVQDKSNQIQVKNRLI